MTVITQRKKGWWKIWVLIGIAIAIIAVIGLLSVLKNADGAPYIDLAPYELQVLSSAEWASQNIFNFALLCAVPFVLGIGATWIFYTYLRGQKVTTAIQQTYNAQAGISQTPQQQGTETTVSS